jgi:hypothetical protein
MLFVGVALHGTGEQNDRVQSEALEMRRGGRKLSWEKSQSNRQYLKVGAHPVELLPASGQSKQATIGKVHKVKVSQLYPSSLPCGNSVHFPCIIGRLSHLMVSYFTNTLMGVADVLVTFVTRRGVIMRPR